MFIKLKGRFALLGEYTNFYINIDSISYVNVEKKMVGLVGVPNALFVSEGFDKLLEAINDERIS